MTSNIMTQLQFGGDKFATSCMSQISNGYLKKTVRQMIINSHCNFLYTTYNKLGA